jgi:hypothetical protein
MRVRLIDDRNRLFGLVNPIDLLVLAAFVVALLVAANVLFGVFEFDDAELVDVQFDVTALAVRGFEPGQVKVGDEIFSTVAGRLGEVVVVKAYPSQVEIVGEDSQVVVVESKILTDVRMTVRGRGSADELGYLVGGVRVQNNTRLDIVTSEFEAERAYVSDVEPAKD